MVTKEKKNTKEKIGRATDYYAFGKFCHYFKFKYFLSLIQSFLLAYCVICYSSLVTQVLLLKYCYSSIATQVLLLKHCYSSIVTQVVSFKYCYSSIITQVLLLNNCYSSIITQVVLLKYCYSSIVTVHAVNS